MERSTPHDRAEMEDASTSPEPSSVKRDTRRRAGATELMLVITPPKRERDILDILDDGIERVDELLFGRY